MPLFLVVIVRKSFLVALVRIRGRLFVWTFQLALVFLEWGERARPVQPRRALGLLFLAAPAVLPDLQHDLRGLSILSDVELWDFIIAFLRSHLDLVLRWCFDHDLTRPHLG